MMAPSSVDDPAVVNAFLRLIGPRKPAAAGTAKPEDVAMKLNPQSKVSVLYNSISTPTDLQ
jgi:hypothetical protein